MAKNLGYDAVKEEQYEVVEKFVRGEDVLVSADWFRQITHYAVLPGLFDLLKKKSGSVALVVSPLVALIKDQVAIFKKKGLNAVWVSPGNEEE